MSAPPGVATQGRAGRGVDPEGTFGPSDSAVTELPLVLVLTCSSGGCRCTFGPDPIAFTVARLCCPSCGGWAFTAELVEPAVDVPVPYVLTDQGLAAAGRGVDVAGEGCSDRGVSGDE